MSRWMAVSIVIACSAAAHAQVPGTTRALGLRRTSFDIEIDVTARQGANRFPLQPDARLRSGDALTVTVRPTAPVTVYVAYVGADHQPVLLYPTNGRRVEVGAGQVVRLPPAGEEIYLDNQTGTETLLVVATRDPLSFSDRVLYDALRGAVGAQMPADPPSPSPPPPPPHRRADHRAGAPPPPQPPQPPTTPSPSPPPAAVRASTDALIGYRTRGMHLGAEDAGATDRWRADDGGVVVWKLSFRHE